MEVMEALQNCNYLPPDMKGHQCQMLIQNQK